MAETPAGELPAGDITALLAEWRAGDRAAGDRLFELLYERLRRVARQTRRRHGAGATLATTALVHETYLRLAERFRTSVEDRERFLAVAATVMRRILVDAARQRTAAKRGDGATPLPIDAEHIAAGSGASPEAEEVVAVDRAYERLVRLDPRLARVVALRYFVGLTLEEVAEATGSSIRTTTRDWQKARVFLYREITGGSPA